MFASPWLTSACPAAAVAESRLPREKAVRTEALPIREPGSAVCGVRAELRGYGTSIQHPALTVRPLGDEQTVRTTSNNSGVRGPQYAWREPVIT
jgi:hypothetical protein